MWVTDNYGQTVSRIDPAVDRVVQTIPVGNAPSGVAAGDGSVWVANASDGTLSRIDTVSGAVSDTVMLGGTPTGVAVGAGGVWVSDEADRRVLRVDPHSDQVTGVDQTSAPGRPRSRLASARYGLTNSLDGTVSRIDPVTNTVTRRSTAGDGAGAIAVGGHGRCGCQPVRRHRLADRPSHRHVSRTVSVGNRPQGLAIAGGLVWVGARAAAHQPSRQARSPSCLTSWADTLGPCPYADRCGACCS